MRPLVLTFFCSSAALAQLPALPEGDTGLAAQYAGDEGIASDPSVVFHENFEAVTGSQLTAANSQWDNIYGGVSVVTNEKHSGAKAAKISLPTAAAYGGWRDFGQAGFDTLFLRYYLRYDPQYPGVHHQGMTLFAGAPGVTTGSSTGVKPNGTNHFTAGLDNIDPRFDWAPPGSATPGYLYIYCYHLDQQGDYGDAFLPSGALGGVNPFGSSFVPRADVIPPLGQWLSFEIMVKANTPGQRDGRLAFWVDGRLTADFPNLRLRTVADLKVNFIVLAPYSSEVLPNQNLWYDDIVAATSYIGPMYRGPARDGGFGSGGSLDAGAPRDAGVRDAGPGVDSGVLDAGGHGVADAGAVTVDAGIAADAGLVSSADAGAKPGDAGVSPGAGVEASGCSSTGAGTHWATLVILAAWFVGRARSNAGQFHAL